jgi:hypothetical protein
VHIEIGRNPVDDIQRLAAVEAIKNTKARYFRFMDAKDWTNLATVLAPDAVFDMRAVFSVPNLQTGELNPPLLGDGHIHRGRDAILARIQQTLGDLVTVHHGFMPEIEILSPTSAEAIFGMEDILCRSNGDLVRHGHGHYHETYERLDAGWAIKTWQLTCQKLDYRRPLPV